MSTKYAILGMMTWGPMSGYDIKCEFERVGPAIPLALITGACLTVVGTALGSVARNQGQLQLCANLIYLVVLFFSPVLLPLEQMPLLMKAVAYLLPPGEAAMALTEALSGNFGPRFWGMTALLMGWLCAGVIYTIYKLDWRQE